MAFIISLVSQKGGVGKSTLARLIAREAAVGGLDVKIADLDTQQKTCTNWAARRIANNVQPEIEVQPVGDLNRAIQDASRYDLYIFDGAPHASTQTLKISKLSDLVIIPSSLTLEDRQPAVELANDLYQEGIPAEQIAFALCLIGESKRQLQDATDYFSKTQYQLLKGAIPRKDSSASLLNMGRSLTEGPFKFLCERAETLAQSIIDATATAATQEKVA
ncbi:MAG: ParA family protein [Chloroflexi bacterium]|nr:ParA family protein [Chloroflexota bacterium]